MWWTYRCDRLFLSYSLPCYNDGPYLKDQTGYLDENDDGKVSLYEFKARGGLTGLPPPGQKQFTMQIMFDPGAGNDFQGDTLDMTLTFSLVQDSHHHYYHHDD